LNSFSNRPGKPDPTTVLDPSKTIAIHTALDNLMAKTVTSQILTSSHFTDINTFSQPDKVKPAAFTGAKKTSRRVRHHLASKISGDARIEVKKELVASCS
jgi:hypothetical protein